MNKKGSCLLKLLPALFIVFTVGMYYSCLIDPEPPTAGELNGIWDHIPDTSLNFDPNKPLRDFIINSDLSFSARLTIGENPVDLKPSDASDEKRKLAEVTGNLIEIRNGVYNLRNMRSEDLGELVAGFNDYSMSLVLIEGNTKLEIAAIGYYNNTEMNDLINTFFGGTYNKVSSLEYINRDPDYRISLSQTGAFEFPEAVKGYTNEPPLEVTVTNDGNRDTGSLSLALSGANADCFTLSAPSLPGISSGASATFSVVPAAGLEAGTYTAAVDVTGANGISSGFTVKFTVVSNYAVSLSASDHTFPYAIEGYSSAPAPLDVTIGNIGDQPTGLLDIVLSGDDQNSFTLSKSSVGSIAVGGSDSFAVAPKTGLAAGSYTAVVTVSGSNGISASLNVSFLVNSDSSFTLSETGSYIFSPAVENYSSVPSLQVTVTNTGSNATGQLQIDLSGSDQNSFELSAALLADLPNNSDSLAFSVSPKSGLAFGTYTATVTVSSSISGFSPAAFDLSFTVDPGTYSISLSETGSYSFPSAVQGNAVPSPRTVTVRNTGDQATGELGVALSGADAGSFKLSVSSLASIPAGSTTRTFTVQPNTGLAAGTYTAVVTVTGGNGISAQFDVGFTVTPYIFSISLSEAGSYSFPSAKQGYGAQTARTITVLNTGNQATGALSVALSGANAGSFTLSATSLASINANATRTFTVRPNTSLAPGTYTATVTVTGGNGIAAGFDVEFNVGDASWRYFTTVTETFQNFMGAKYDSGMSAIASVNVKSEAEAILVAGPFGATLTYTERTIFQPAGLQSLTFSAAWGPMQRRYPIEMWTELKERTNDGIKQWISGGDVMNPVPEPAHGDKDGDLTWIVEAGFLGAGAAKGWAISTDVDYNIDTALLRCLPPASNTYRLTVTIPLNDVFGSGYFTDNGNDTLSADFSSYPIISELLETAKFLKPAGTFTLEKQ